MACKPVALRSLDVCLDSRGPFIDAFSSLVSFRRAADDVGRCRTRQLCGLRELCA
jgi:hypothetical protein